MVNNPQPEQEIVEYKVRRAVGVRALRKISTMVAEERKVEADKARIVRWFVCYGWLAVAGGALLVAYLRGAI